MLSEYAVFNAYADNGHLFIEIIKVLPPIPVILNSVLAQRRLSVLLIILFLETKNDSKVSYQNCIYIFFAVLGWEIISNIWDTRWCDKLSSPWGGKPRESREGQGRRYTTQIGVHRSHRIHLQTAEAISSSTAGNNIFYLNQNYSTWKPKY